MKIITAIENKKINEELKKIKDIKVLNSDIQYKEGILEYLEKDKKVDIIFLKESLPGQIELEELSNKIKKINNQIRIIIFTNKNNQENKDFSNIKQIYLEEITIKDILRLLKKRKQNKKIESNIIKINGNRGSGKTVLTIIFAKILAETKNKKVLIIEENQKNTLIKRYLKNNFDKNLNEKKVIKIQENVYLFNNKNTPIKTQEFLEKIKKEYYYIFIDGSNRKTEYDKLINKKVFLLEQNILEIEKAKNFLIQKDIKIIMNKVNINALDTEIIEKIFHKKIEQIRYSKNFNLLINHQFNINFLSKRERKHFIKIIEKIIK